MAVDEKMVARAATLSRIAFKPDEQAAFVPELNDLLAWADKVLNIDTEDVGPTVSVMHGTPAWRSDEVTVSGLQDILMQNAPDSGHGFFAVPKVVE